MLVNGMATKVKKVDFVWCGLKKSLLGPSKRAFVGILRCGRNLHRLDYNIIVQTALPWGIIIRKVEVKVKKKTSRACMCG